MIFNCGLRRDRDLRGADAAGNDGGDGLVVAPLRVGLNRDGGARGFDRGAGGASLQGLPGGRGPLLNGDGRSSGLPIERGACFRGNSGGPLGVRVGGGLRGDERGLLDAGLLSGLPGSVLMPALADRRRWLALGRQQRPQPRPETVPRLRLAVDRRR